MDDLKALLTIIQQQQDLILRRLDFIDAQLTGMRTVPTYNPMPNHQIHRDPPQDWGLSPQIIC